ncbi:GntR family transcriptional regulator [Actinobacillus succinogenes]|uniref:Transcriptional regulator, GntR family n=1 Tax=Actinobacillus succinogenes (strain ATCC 55618 / DSM 22257 / CCUG 43843 / 130Z) TaxID=339671 RepID=A6VLA3_ACTSZ|nr:GntR family transcriptional regulator [Actinobacillus succinogenes]ABR73750.1 transcriptional regulator, GntR family [Actinobacillus succinogenes 130Z]PHI39792.1 GntR family transcriptional regulator [Actinobacillus succinogenes]
MIEPKLRESSRDYAYRVIREMIVNMELVPGSKVSEIELANLLGISRTPVREALIDLARNGAVTIQPQKGTFISLIDSDLVEEARFLRKTLEKEVIALLCEDSYQKDLHILDESLSLQEFYLKQGNYEKFLELDNEFHQLFFKITHKDRIYALMKGLNIHFDRARTSIFKKKPSIKTLEEHKILLKAIHNQDKDTATQCIERHLYQYELDKDSFEKEYSHYFNKSGN